MKTTLVGMALFILTGSASATLMDFNYGNFGVAGGDVYDSLSMTADGITVNISGYTINNDGNGNITSQTLLSSGTGVYVSGSSAGNVGVKSSSGDGTLMDGGDSNSDPDEGLLFSFSQAVSLKYLNFDYFSNSEGDDFNLTVDGVRVLWDFNANDVSPLVGNVAGQFDEYTFNNIVGSQFLIWADGDSDAFRIDRMEISAVPEPASLLMFATGLLAFGYSQRKRA